MGIGVVPVKGVSDLVASDLSERVADALSQRDIPAQFVGQVGRLGFSLEGNMKGTTVADGITSIEFYWRLTDRSGDIVQCVNQTVRIDEHSWMLGSENSSDLIAQDIATQLVALIAPPITVATPTASPWQGLTITIQPPKEAPGDGATALSRALANRIAQQGFEPAVDKPDYFIAGTVSVSRYDSVQDDIAVIWQVLSADGQDLGEVRLDNRIPTGELDGSWSMVAEAIIAAALPGILEIIAATLPIETP